ncbi:hypothetical protein [Nocardia sp. NPDC052566]|uniref:hypothetical protein n=1 Tax=Nocardia sp. NPDC052566 TaxID=3364330 RepID=UPI0037C7F8B4
MGAAGSTRLDDFGFAAVHKLGYGHVGHWYAPADSDTADSRTPRTVAVEIDPGDGSSVVVFVQAPNQRDLPNDFHPDDQVCLVMPEDIEALLDECSGDVASSSRSAITRKSALGTQRLSR